MNAPAVALEPTGTAEGGGQRSRLLPVALVAAVAVAGVSFLLAVLGFAHALVDPELAGPQALQAAVTDPLGLRVVTVVGLVVPLSAAAAAAGVLFWYGRDRWMPLLLGLVLITGGPGVMGLLATHQQHPALRPFVETIWIVGATVLVVALFAFPDGRFVPRWSRWLAGSVVVVFPVLLGPVFATDLPYRTVWEIALRQPDSLEVVPSGRWQALVAVAATYYGAGLAAQLYRYRRVSGPAQRRQTRWVMGTLGTLLAISVGGMLILGALIDIPPSYVGWMFLVAVIPMTLFPLTVANAVLRHRLHGIDIAISKTLVIGLLAVFITVVYVGIVVGFGYLLGTAGRPGTALSVLATAIVAVGFQPVRQRVQRLANRLVYGERATPYEVMAGFGRSMAASLSLEDVLPRMAEAAATGVGGEAAEASVRLPSGGSGLARWPEPAPGEPVRERAWDGRVAVTHKGEVVGDIAVAKPPGERLRPAEERLLDAMANQAGLALHNVRLAAELRARLDEIAAQASELRASRQRIVAAQADELRRMERKIYDGAQHQLVGMRVKLGLAERVVDDDPGRAAAVLTELGTDANATLEELRDLARGIFPPLLADQGLVPALQAHLRKRGIPADLLADDSVQGVRFGEQEEVTAYFCCVETLNNAATHAPESAVTVRLTFSDDRLRVAVSDDGPGFDPGAGYGDDLRSMADRVEALGGTLRVESAPGQGTTVRAAIPAQPAQAVEPADQASAKLSGPNADLGT